MRLVVKLARNLRGYGVPDAELVSEGNVGLMQALKRFDPERGFRFATYALWWIRAAMHEHVLDNWSLVNIGTTGAQKRLFFNLRRLKAQMDSTGDSEPTAEQIRQIADTLNVPEQDVISISQRLSGRDYSLNVVPGSDAEGDWQDWLVDPADSQETTIAAEEEFSQRRALLPAALRTLNPRERH
jgi:RNA polymerase sigma-32 factor